MGDGSRNGLFFNRLRGINCNGSGIYVFIKFMLNNNGNMCGEWYAWWHAWIKLG